MVTFESIFVAILVVALIFIVLLLVAMFGMFVYDSYLDLKIWRIQKKNRLRKIKHEEN